MLLPAPARPSYRRMPAPLLDRRLAARASTIPPTSSARPRYTSISRPLPLNCPSVVRQQPAWPRSRWPTRTRRAPPGGDLQLRTATSHRIDVRRHATLLLPEETHDASFAMTPASAACCTATLAALARASTRIGPVAHATAAVIEGRPRCSNPSPAHATIAWVFLGSGLLRNWRARAALKLGELSNGARSPPASTRRSASGTAPRLSSPRTPRYSHSSPTIRSPGSTTTTCSTNCAATASPRAWWSWMPRRASNRASRLSPFRRWHGRRHRPGLALRRRRADLRLPRLARARAHARQPNPGGTVNRVVQGVRIHGAP